MLVIKNKISKIIILFSVIIIELLILLFFMNQLGFFSEGLKGKKCYNLPEGGFGPGATDTNYIDCIGYLNIEQSNTANLESPQYALGNVLVYDTQYSLSFITKVKAYHIENNFLYVIGDLDYDVYDNGAKNGMAFSRIPINGKLQFIDFASPSDVPHFFKINGETGDMTLYKDFAEMSDAESTIFKELDANKKDYVQEFKRESKKLNNAIFGGVIDFLLLFLTAAILISKIIQSKNKDGQNKKSEF